MQNKKALVCGAGGFIGSHLVKRLKEEGYWVRGVDLKRPEFSETHADNFMELDLRSRSACRSALTTRYASLCEFDEVYQLAADMGGMGFIDSAECEIMHNSILINVNMIYEAIERMNVPKYFFSSSVCVYRDMKIGEDEIDENGAYPAMPHNEYGWEKLYSERMLRAYCRKYQNKKTWPSIARFQNCYGTEGTWKGGREKAPAALSRKVAEAKDGDSIEIWGDGTAIRNFIYVDDLIDGIRLLMREGPICPVNIGTDEYVTVNDLAQTIIDISGKKLSIKHIDGPVGVQSRNFSNKLIKTLGWEPKYSLRKGLEKTYFWVEQQVRKSQ